MAGRGLSASRWNYRNVRKGLDAETRDGQVIEYAISAEGCAVAHSVGEIAKRGDIDHQVATPRGVRVLETKYRRVPGNRFPKVLKGIAANVEAVRGCRNAPSRDRAALRLAFSCPGLDKFLRDAVECAGTAKVSEFLCSLDGLCYGTPTVEKEFKVLSN